MDDLDIGPVDILMIRFPGTQLHGAVGPAVADLVGRGLVRIIDGRFVYRDEDGRVGSLDRDALIERLGPEASPPSAQFSGHVLADDDVDEAAAGLSAGSSVLVLVVDNRWAIPFVNAMRGAGAELFDQSRIPAEIAAGILTGAARPA